MGSRQFLFSPRNIYETYPSCCIDFHAGRFFATASFAQVVISEIHYHPVEEPAFNADGSPVLDLTEDVHEFIEIQNAGASAVDLSGWTISNAVSFTFPNGTTIAPGASLVIAKNPARLAVVYGLNAIPCG